MRNDLVDACLFASLFETLDIFGIDRFSGTATRVAREEGECVCIDALRSLRHRFITFS